MKTTGFEASRPSPLPIPRFGVIAPGALGALRFAVIVESVRAGGAIHEETRH